VAKERQCGLLRRQCLGHGRVGGFKPESNPQKLTRPDGEIRLFPSMAVRSIPVMPMTPALFVCLRPPPSAMIRVRL